MAEHRKVRTRGGQVLVPVPALIWRRLKIGEGSTVWWHLAGKDEAMLSRYDRRRGGRPRMEDTCPHCEQREKEVVRLRALVQTGGAVNTRTSFNQGYHAGLAHGIRGQSVLDVVNERLRRIEDHLGTRVGPWTYREKRRRSRGRTVETAPAPVLAAPDLSEGPHSP